MIVRSGDQWDREGKLTLSTLYSLLLFEYFTTGFPCFDTEPFKNK